MDVVKVRRGEIDVMALPSKEIDCCNKAKYPNTCRGRPHNDWISEKIVFDG